MEIKSNISSGNRYRFTSSVIISLLAGFIYYQFGEDISHKLDFSMRAIPVESNSDFTESVMFEPFSSLIKKSDNKIIKSRSGNFKRLKINNSDFSKSENLISEIKVKQANIQKPIPDKNIDFTAELDILRDKNSKYSKINNLNSNKLKVIAEEDCKLNKVKVKIFTDENSENGYGFEYNNTKVNRECVINNKSGFKENVNKYKIKVYPLQKIKFNKPVKEFKTTRKDEVVKPGNRIIIIDKNEKLKKNEIYIHEETLEEDYN